jgi:hypothetical protein
MHTPPHHDVCVFRYVIGDVVEVSSELRPPSIIVGALLEQLHAMPVIIVNSVGIGIVVIAVVVSNASRSCGCGLRSIVSTHLFHNQYGGGGGTAMLRTASSTIISASLWVSSSNFRGLFLFTTPRHLNVIEFVVWMENCKGDQHRECNVRRNIPSVRTYAGFSSNRM